MMGKKCSRHAALLAAAGIVLAVSCDSLFSTRDPEPPVNSQSGWKQPLSPEQVLLNMQSAVAERHVENFVRCLVNASFSEETFRFEPDPDVSADHAGVFDGWTVAKEQTVIQQAFSLVPMDSSSLLAFGEEIWQSISADEAVYDALYTLELPHTRSSLSTSFEGRLTFTLSPDQRGEWSIHHWIDNAVGDSPCWSLLKAVLGG